MNEIKEYQDPKSALQRAIEELNTFTQPKVSRLELENGRLIATSKNFLERIIGFAKSHIGSFLSHQVRLQQEKKLTEIKRAILQARDIIQTHSALIDKFQVGDDVQRKLADCALLAIQRYNAIVAQDPAAITIKHEMYNYDRQLLLLDQEIYGRPIELPREVSVKFDSHPDAHPAKKMLKELGQTFLLGVERTAHFRANSTHKKSIQFMIDTFQMKAIRMIQTHLPSHYEMGEILTLVKESSLDIDEESIPELISMRQFIEIDPGTFILISGCFKKNSSDPKFLTMPLLDSFRLSFQLTHTGFPYPSQHTAWALTDKWVDASPLRTEQVPLFQKINEKRKALAHQLLFNMQAIQATRQKAKMKRLVFDQNLDLFLPLHRSLQEYLAQSFWIEADSLLDQLYQEASKAPSPFNYLVQTQMQMLELYVKQPMKALEEEWLGNDPTPLRIGTPSEKFHTTCEKLEHYRQLSFEQPGQHPYVRRMGLELGKAFRSIGLQYQSEKMGFSPPLLNNLERKLQACAFQQLLLFFDECQSPLSNLEQIKQELLLKGEKDLKLLTSTTIEEINSPVAALVDELANYFNWRFYSLYPR